jgi:hypothetical protein
MFNPGSKETEELKKTFEEHLKEKEEFEMLIKKQEADLKGQLRYLFFTIKKNTLI